MKMESIAQATAKPKVTIKTNWRSPTLQTVLMVENFIKEHNSEFKKTELFENLPKKMMWGTFQTIMRYLEDNFKIIIEDDGVITYIWNPELVKKYSGRKDLEWRE